MSAAAVYATVLGQQPSFYDDWRIALVYYNLGIVSEAITSDNIVLTKVIAGRWEIWEYGDIATTKSKGAGNKQSDGS